MWRAWLLCLGVACTKANPSATCADGTCKDPAYPFCDVDGAIGGVAGECLAVSCTPGSVGACEGDNAALVCDEAGTNYLQMPCAIGCDAVAKVCTNLCTGHSQCSSGICKADGSCAATSEIVFVSATGSPVSDCSQQVPCTLSHALTLATPAGGQYISLSAGEYANTGSLTVSGKRVLVGSGAATTVVRNTSHGPILVVDGNSDVTIDSISLRDATGDPSNSNVQGQAISCPSTPPGIKSLHVIDAIFSNNGYGGTGGGAIITGTPCTVELRRSLFDGNYDGVVVSGSATVDRCTFSGGGVGGITVYGDFAITNSFMVRNQAGVTMVSADSASTFAFNTIADNSAYGLNCGQPTIILENNIIVRNATNIVDQSPSPNCPTPGSIVATDASALLFKHADTVPYDYHIAAGSIAIDAASSGTIDHDFDGDARPIGAGRDVGADEAF